jgi:hypothetical protein
MGVVTAGAAEVTSLAQRIFFPGYRMEGSATEDMDSVMAFGADFVDRPLQEKNIFRCMRTVTE